MKNRQEFFMDLIIWIDNNIEKPLKIDDVAIKSGYSKWHLQRLFFSETGQSLGEFIRERKLILIAETLTTTNESLINIAIRFGFDSQQSLNRAFRKKYNLPPNQYRKIAISIQNNSRWG
ncbi:helix-turn-helix domain-containing protein [Martelella alba]|uniref:Helix-turn-helix domain-containing protein n=1 Tax=Martelella alba TaxID=2590451 RepID=A0ABY2SPN9_9HYPH|nr:helix-turn-helix domain-containing protein [Martelella alba]TKI07914.1 helix-turn-helix domain-containing protein [Martelella alba]